MDILPIHEVSSDSYFVLASRLHSHEPRGPRRPPDTERANPPAEPCGERGERAAPPGFSRFLRAVAESCMSWYNDSTYMYTLPGVYTQVGAFMLSARSEYAVTRPDVIPPFDHRASSRRLTSHIRLPRQLRVANSVQLAKCHGHSSLYSYTPGWHFTTHSQSRGRTRDALEVARRLRTQILSRTSIVRVTDCLALSVQCLPLVPIAFIVATVLVAHPRCFLVFRSSAELERWRCGLSARLNPG